MSKFVMLFGILIVFFISVNVVFVSGAIDVNPFGYTHELGSASNIGRGQVSRVNETWNLENVTFGTAPGGVGDAPQQVYVANITNGFGNIMGNASVVNVGGTYKASFKGQNIVLYPGSVYYIVANGTWQHLSYTNGFYQNGTSTTSGVAITWEWRLQCNVWPSCSWDLANGVMGGINQTEGVSCLKEPSYSGCPTIPMSPPSVPSFVSSTPLNNTITLNASWINVSCVASNVSLWADVNVNPVTPVAINRPSGFFSWLVNFTTTNNYYYKASCINETGSSANTSVYKLTYAYPSVEAITQLGCVRASTGCFFTTFGGCNYLVHS